MRGVLIATAAPMLLLLAAGCREVADGPPPAPIEITREATGYYCSMIIADHPGPKAQIHLSGRGQPLFFPSVVDAIAFLNMPGESKAIRAIYVNDMGKARNWGSPEPGTWTNAREAFFVIDSRKESGMKQKEAVPFSGKEAAERFADENGGRIVRLAGIPASYVFPPASAAEASPAPAPQNNDEAVP